MDLQKLIDDQIARYPQVLTYVEWVKYVPQGQAFPKGTTHLLKLEAVLGKQDLLVALAVKEPYNAIATALLGVL